MPNSANDVAVDFWAVFESSPDAYLLLAPDAPHFTMVAANEARLRATMTRREDVIGHALFEVFPDNPGDPQATGVRNLRASLDEVLRTKRPHRMALQKYDIRRRDGTFEERYWDPLNSPVFDESGTLIYIIHRVEDVTEQVRTGRRLKDAEALLSRLRESEERYRLLVDMIPQNIWTTDPQGHHTYFSRRWYEFSGSAPGQSHGEGWLEFIHPEDKERTLARWQHSLDTGEPYEIEYRFRGTDGAYRWFLGKATPLRDESGKIIEWFGTATDISERKRHDEERERLLAREREAREEVTTILESVTDAFYALDDEWRFTYVNREAERLLKCSREKLLGHVLWEEFPGAVGADIEREYRRAVAERRMVDFETYAKTIGLWVNVRAYPSGSGLSVFFHDVTDRKRAEEQLRESERTSGHSRTAFRSSPGWRIPTAGSSGTTIAGTNTPGPRSRRCKAGDGRRSTIPLTWRASSSESSMRSRLENPGKTPSLSAAGPASTAGFSRAPCRSVMAAERSCDGSGRTRTLPWSARLARRLSGGARSSSGSRRVARG